MTYRTVIFDLDGTLIDTVPLIVESYQHTFRTVLGQEREAAWIRSTIGTPLHTVFHSASPDRVDELTRTYLDYNLARLDQCQVLPGAAETLQALLDRGIPLGVATSKKRASAVATLAASPLPEIPVLAAYEDTTEHKPLAAPIHHALAALGQPAERAVYVGDTVHDIRAAQAAGVAAVALPTGAESRERLAAAGPNHMLGALPELLALI